MNERILRLPEVEKVTGLPRPSIYRMMKDNEFPKAINISTRSIGWLGSEVDDWIEKKVKQARILSEVRYDQN